MGGPTRRSVLAAALGAGLGGGLAVGASGCSGPAGVDVRRGTLRSRHLPGRELGWVIAAPTDADAVRPPVVVLHGFGAGASAALGTLHLDEHVAATGLTVAAVDGGNGYWHARRDGTDAGAMVLEDFLPLVAREHGPTDRIALLGWSMGGYGSLLLASDLGPGRVAAVVAESAALWRRPGDSPAAAFDSRDDYDAHDVFSARRRAVLARIPVRLDCGRSDPFAAANRAFAAALPSAALTLDAGAHTGGYWRDHAGAQLRWLRSRLDAAPPA